MICLNAESFFVYRIQSKVSLSTVYKAKKPFFFFFFTENVLFKKKENGGLNKNEKKAF